MILPLILPIGLPAPFHSDIINVVMACSGRDRIVKSGKYAEFGVEEYWIVDPESRTLEQYRLTPGGTYYSYNVFEDEELVTSDKLPCVSFKVCDIFAEMLQ